MNALGVVRDNLVLPARIAHGSLLAFAVAARAEPGDIGRKSRRLRILFAQHAMRAMAFLAGRGIRIILAGKLPVDAGYVELANFVVAGAAVHGSSDGFARTAA